METQELAAAEELIRSLDPEAALVRFDQALAKNPEDAAALGGRIRSLWLLRRHPEARRALDGAPLRLRNTAELQVARGVIALGQRDDLIHLGIRYGSLGRDPEAAEAAFEQAVAADPSNVVARRGLATVHRLTGRVDRAQAVLGRALDELGTDPGLLVESAWCSFDLGWTDAALDTLAECPDDVEALFATGLILRETGDLQRANVELDRLSRLVPAASVALLTEYAWLELQLGELLAPGQAADSWFLRAEKQFTEALEALPGHPSALAGLAALAGPLQRPSGTAAQLSAAAHMTPEIALGWARVSYREADYAQAAGWYRRARELDPHVTSGVSGEIDALQREGRVIEARRIGDAALAASPGLGGLRSQVAWLEYRAGRYERALGHFEQLGQLGGEGRVSCLRLMECFDQAETLARDLLAGPRQTPFLLNELALCAFHRGHYAEAVLRFERTLQLDPGDQLAAELLTKARKKLVGRRIRALWQIPIGEVAQRNAHLGHEREAVVSAMLPADTPPRLLGRLSKLTWRVLALKERQDRVEDLLTPVLASAIVLLGLSSIRLLGPLGCPAGGGWAGGLLYLPEFGFSALFTWLLTSVAAGLERTVMVLLTLGAGGALGAVLWCGGGHPNPWALVPVLAASVAVGVLWLVYAVISVSDAVTASRTRRLHAKDPHTYLVSDLIELLTLLENESALPDPGVRRRCLELLEDIAAGQERVLVEPLGGGRRRDRSTGAAFRQYVAGVAAATRDLKRSVLSPGPETWGHLRTHLEGVLAATCHGRWNDLPYRQPDTVRQALRLRLVSGVRSLLVLLVPPGVMLGLQSAHVIPGHIPLAWQLLGYLGWPAVVLLLWLDPSLAGKIETLRKSSDLIRQDAPSEGK